MSEEVTLKKKHLGGVSLNKRGKETPTYQSLLFFLFSYGAGIAAGGGGSVTESVFDSFSGSAELARITDRRSILSGGTDPGAFGGKEKEEGRRRRRARKEEKRLKSRGGDMTEENKNTSTTIPKNIREKKVRFTLISGFTKVVRLSPGSAKKDRLGLAFFGRCKTEKEAKKEENESKMEEIYRLT